MGQAIACCGNNDQDKSEVNTHDPAFYGHTQGEIKGSDKIALIVKIQSVFRGYLTRKYVQELRASNAPGFMNRPSYVGDPNWDNEDVARIREELGEFEYGKEEHGLEKR